MSSIEFLLFYLLKECALVVTFIIILLIIFVLGYKLHNDWTKMKCTSSARLDGKVVLVTGGNSGIGFETAKDLARRGARVIIASRNEQKSAIAVEDIKQSTGNNQVEYRYLDLSKFSNVRTFAEEFNASFDRLDILINNAGVTGITHHLTEDGIDKIIQINYMSPFLLTNLLLDKIITSKPSRIVIVSTVLYHFGKLDLKDLRNIGNKPGYLLYCNSKLYNVLWAKALARKLPDGVTVNVLHPGFVYTDIFDHLGPILGTLVKNIFKPAMLSVVEGAQTTIHVAVAEELKNVSGKYFSMSTKTEGNKKVNREDLVEKVWQESLLITDSKLSY